MIDIIAIIIRAIIAICGVLVTAKLIPWLTEKLGAEQTADLVAWVRTAVAAAEQLFDSSAGAEKKQYVLNFLTSKGFDVTEDELDKLIEAAVLELHNALDLPIVNLGGNAGS